MKHTPEHVLGRRTRFDDVYVPVDAPVYTPELHDSVPRHIGARRWLAGALVVVMCASSTGLTYGSLSATGAWMADTETSSLNTFVAGLLDFIGIETPQAYNIMEATQVVVPITITPEPESVVTDFRVTTSYTSGSASLCNKLNANVVTPFSYSGGLLSLTGAASTTGSLSITLTLSDAAGLVDGEACTFDVVYVGWDQLAPESTGYTDEERISVTITYVAEEVVVVPPNPADIVLNEFLPNPDPSAGGLNFGTDSDSNPLGEWIELYNKGPVAQDIAGWYITDASGGVGNTHAVIDNTNTNTGNTIIPAGGWLVVFTNKPSLNNTGDEIYLYPVASTTPVDFVSYNDPSSDCENDPTQGAGNVGTGQTGTPGNGPNADCVANQVAPNKSYARIPDGTGPWIDPIPTPGSPNILEDEPAPPAPLVEEPPVDEPVVEEPPVEDTPAEEPVVEEPIVEEPIEEPPTEEPVVIDPLLEANEQTPEII